MSITQPSLHATNQDLLDAVCEVLDRMYFAALGPAEDAMPAADSALICMQVSFRGTLQGALWMRVYREAAMQLQDDFTAGSSQLALDDAARDAVGELCNIVCGSLLSNLDPHGEYRLDQPLPDKEMPFGGEQPHLSCALSVNDSLVEARLRWSQPQ
ncbi:MAG: chemotaxis protein CheX [Bryobacterales bacterium]|jgi:CheY-specific phosphatase CheX|nr:chemotaxis protein CheX [Bryobacterales bacterium]